MVTGGNAELVRETDYPSSCLFLRVHDNHDKECIDKDDLADEHGAHKEGGSILAKKGDDESAGFDVDVLR